MDLEEYRRSIIDAEHLRLLSPFYWVSGVLTALFTLYFLVYLALGIGLMVSPSSSSSTSSGDVGWVFLLIGGAGFLIVGAVATLKILTGFWIRKRRHPVLCLVTAGLSCFEVPYGTMLGALTFAVLLRPSVSAMFGFRGGAEPPRTIPEPPPPVEVPEDAR